MKSSKQNCGGNFIKTLQAAAFMLGPSDDFHMQPVCHDQNYPADYLLRGGGGGGG